MSDETKLAAERWKKEVLAAFEKKSAPRELTNLLAGGGNAQTLYTPADVSPDYLGALGFPGEPPFTRGVQPNMHRGRFWTMRQYAGFGTAAESNKRYHYLLQKGQTGLSVAFDLPTQMGRDSDHPLARGEVGKVGVAVDSLEDMETLFAGIPLRDVSTSMTINSTASILLALYVAVGEKQGVAADVLRGTIQNDILKEYIARGTYIFPPRPSLRVINDIFSWCATNAPKWNTISISGYHMREAGCDAIQEVAFTLADGIAYVETAVKAGLDVDTFGQQLSFFFNGHNNVIEEVAKFRAARRLWDSIMKERFGAKSKGARALRFHVQTAGVTLQAQQPLVNTVRVTLQALAAVMGGCQSLHTNGYDEALSLPTEESATLALRTQQVIAYESGVADLVDALGGSYAIEAMTDRIEAGARNYIATIDAMGGMVDAIEEGYVQREIQNTAYQYQLQIERSERVIVGVNKFQGDTPPIPFLRVDPKLEAEQVARLQGVRSRRDNAKSTRACDEVERIAREGGNLMPAILDAVKSYATVGEISDSMRKVFGEHVEHVTV
ncbi:MAG: methylmalonyl-CoA mutase [Sandaracinaceae bacterium]|nr:methylmalonyl-CoA mutase [Sandaracinaceae bacterium]